MANQNPRPLPSDANAPTGRFIALIVSMLLPAALPSAVASGHIGPWPIAAQRFRSFGECRAYLERRYADDVASAKITNTADSNIESKHAIESQGVVQHGKREARYDVVKSHVSRTIMDDSKTIEFQYSYLQSNLVCKGRILIGTAMQGYHLPTYEPIEQPVKEVAVMPAPESAPTPGNPALTAEEISKQFLKLIEQLKSRSDLSVESIQSVLGVTLEHVRVPNENLEYYAYSQKLDSGWNFSVHYNPASPGLKEGIGLSFSYSEGGDGSMQTVCPLAFDNYHNALKEIGYRDVPIYGEIGELRSWRYYKGDITLSVIPQDVVAGEGARVCVKSIGTLN